MTVTISAGDAQGSRNEETLYQQVPTDAARALLRLLDADLGADEGTVFLASDEDTYDFYGELGSEISPAAIGRIFAGENLTADAKAIADQIGVDLIQKLISLGQVIRINVGNRMEAHVATVSTDGTCADEPVMDVCYSTARYAFSVFGQDLPKVTEVFTYKAGDIVARDHVADNGDRYLTRLLGVAQYAVKRFGPNATLLVG